jgi:hypothetical protein
MLYYVRRCDEECIEWRILVAVGGRLWMLLIRSYTRLEITIAT